MQDSSKESFGQLFARYRSRSFIIKKNKYLSQEEMVDEIVRWGGIRTSRNTVSLWEKDHATINHEDRPTLTAIIATFLSYESLKTLDEANHFLSAGGYSNLNPEEISRINPAWLTLSEDNKEIAGKTKSALTFEEIQTNPRSGNMSFIQSGPGSAPPMPTLYIGRDQDMQELKKRLGIGNDKNASMQVLTAVRGWPGVGKTTTAAALAHDPEMNAIYPDGILWTSLGRNPIIFAKLGEWGRALGYYEVLSAHNPQEATNLLASILRNKRMLLIVDDVWKAEDAEPFKVAGRSCGMIFTTRQFDTASGIVPTPDQIYRLGVLSDTDSLELLKKLSPYVVAKHPVECKELVKKLEGLPLALKVAGRLLQTEYSSGLSVTNLFCEIKEGAILLETDTPPDRRDLINETTPSVAALLFSSLDHLDVRTRDCYAYLSVFAEAPASFSLENLRFIWKNQTAELIVKELVGHGLLEFVPETGRYQMHALLVMLARSLLTDDGLILNSPQ